MPLPQVDTSALNEAQAEAVRRAREEALLLLWGHPGSGKTRSLSVIVRSALAGNKRVLICSATNKAVDQLLHDICEDLQAANSTALAEGKVIRIGEIRDEKLRSMQDLEGVGRIVERLAADARKRQEEITARLPGMRARLRELNTIRKQFADLDRHEEQCRRLAVEESAAASRAAAAKGAADEACRRLATFRDELARRNAASRFRRLFMRSAVRIETDIRAARAAADDARKELDRRSTAHAGARDRRRQAESTRTGLAAALGDRDREALEREREDLVKEGTNLRKEREDLDRAISERHAAVIQGAMVVGATATKVYLSPADMGAFDLVIIDEASMALPPIVYFAVGLARERAVIAGDFRQLPAVLELDKQAVGKSIDRDVLALIDQDIFALNDVDRLLDKHRRTVMLEQQYRMAAPICRLVAGSMYGGRLVTAPDRLSISEPKPPSPFDRPLTVVDTSALKPVQSFAAGGSRFNVLHAMLVRELVERFRDGGLFAKAGGSAGAASSLGICAPYKAQAKLIGEMLRDAGLEDFASVGSVHVFQGDERRIIIIDTTVCPDNRGGIGRYAGERAPDGEGARLYNVAVTRAREHLILIADCRCLKRCLPEDAFLGEILDRMEREGARVDAHDFLAIHPGGRAAASPRQGVESEAIALFDARTFLPAVRADLSDARRSILIYSGYFTGRRIKEYADLFRAKQAEGVGVRCVTCPPAQNTQTDRGERGCNVLNWLEEEIGVSVDLRDKAHEKAVIIDGEVVWWGSLNPLSFNETKAEVMTRLRSPGMARRLAEFLASERGIGRDTRPEDFARPENPRCEECGGRTFYVRGRTRAVFRCEDQYGNGCRWSCAARARRPEARQRAERQASSGPRATAAMN